MEIKISREIVVTCEKNHQQYIVRSFEELTDVIEAVADYDRRSDIVNAQWEFERGLCHLSPDTVERTNDNCQIESDGEVLTPDGSYISFDEAFAMFEADDQQKRLKAKLADFQKQIDGIEF